MIQFIVSYAIYMALGCWTVSLAKRAYIHAGPVEILLWPAVLPATLYAMYRRRRAGLKNDG